MEDKAKDMWAKVKDTVGGLSKTVKAAIIAVIVVLLVGLAVWLSWNSNTDYKELFTDLNAEDMSSITKYLSDNGITDILIKDEDTIMVPASQEAQLRAQLIAEGYPKSGTDYSLYLTHISALSTESDRAQLALYETNNRLAATIRYLEGVQDAVVNIAPGEDRRFVLGQDETLNASASVVVTMKDGAAMNAKLAESIRAIVSHAVKGLIIDDVDIRDSQGNSFDGSDNMDVKTIAAMKLDLEDQWNKKLRRQVLDVLEPMFGEGNVSVSANTTVEMSTSYSESTTYSQPDWAGGNTGGEGIIGKKVWSGRVARGEGNAGGVVGAAPNADLNTYVQEYTPTGDEDALEVSGETEFENNKTTTQQERIGGYIDDVTIAVSINSRVPNTTNPQDLVAHVARSVGINANVQDQKISVISHDFYSPEENQPAVTEPVANPLADIPLWVYLALLAGLFLFMTVFLVFVLLGRSHSRRRLQQLEPAVVVGPEQPLEMEENEEAVEPAGADIMDVHTEKSMELRRSVRELAESNPEIAAQAIKTLLRGDEEGNGG